MNSPNARLLLPGAMARLVRVPVQWLVEEARAGRIPHLNAGGRMLFRPDVVTRLLVERAAGSKEVEHE